VQLLDMKAIRKAGKLHSRSLQLSLLSLQNDAIIATASGHGPTSPGKL